MKKNTKKWLNIFYLAVFVLIFVQLVIIFPKTLEIKDDDDFSDEVVEQKVKTEQKMQGVHLVESQGGSRDWELFSQSAAGNQAEGSWALKEVKVNFYSKENLSFTVTGEEGQIDSGSKDLKIRGHVRTVSSNGYSFETESVSYTAQKREIVSPDAVKVLGPSDQLGEGLTITGYNLVANVDKNLMKIHRAVNAKKQLTDGKLFQITSQEVELSGLSKEAQFNGQVKITYGEPKSPMSIEGPKAIFKYSQDNKVLNQLTVSGGVKVIQEDKRATADVLDLDLLTNNFVFNGNPKLVQNEDELVGDKIIFLDGGKKVKVERIKAQLNPSK